MGYPMLISVLILLSCFILIGNKSVKAYVRTFQVQSVLIAASAALLGIENLGRPEKVNILIVCVIVVVIKGIYIPRLLLKTFDNVKYVIEKSYFFSVPILEIFACIIVIFCYFTIPSNDWINHKGMNSYLVNSVSVILIGFLFMISRKKAIGQIVGFLVIENGLFITALFTTQGMPIVIDLGMFIDLISAVLILGIFVFEIDKQFDSTDINKLKNLRG